ncbi:hypothetical protein K7X08_035601 [Anisodus acutangulus]|uniref:Uncharacterized protein n=1 Tax=Anisodus acutangulus TaxID=402998 RepID=A0A9Q1LKU0_9SOLA|nr:hypothetical protein K7X08_035601 [Anisodus acutangulus]
MQLHRKQIQALMKNPQTGMSMYHRREQKGAQVCKAHYQILSRKISPFYQAVKRKWKVNNLLNQLPRPNHHLHHARRMNMGFWHATNVCITGAIK